MLSRQVYGNNAIKRQNAVGVEEVRKHSPKSQFMFRSHSQIQSTKWELPVSNTVVPLIEKHLCDLSRKTLEKTHSWYNTSEEICGPPNYLHCDIGISYMYSWTFFQQEFAYPTVSAPVVRQKTNILSWIQVLQTQQAPHIIRGRRRCLSGVTWLHLVGKIPYNVVELLYTFGHTYSKKNALHNFFPHLQLNL